MNPIPATPFGADFLDRIVSPAYGCGACTDTLAQPMGGDISETPREYSERYANLLDSIMGLG